MKVRMVSTLAGPSGCYDAGKVYELEGIFGKKLVEEGHAVYVDRVNLNQNFQVETADKPTEVFERRESLADPEESAAPEGAPVVEHKRRGRPRK